MEILADAELLRLAVPRRVFTLSQIKYVIDRLQWLYDNRKMIGGLTFVYEPPVLRFFMGGLAPTSDWPEQLMLKFRKDFGDSLEIKHYKNKAAVSELVRLRQLYFYNVLCDKDLLMIKLYVPHIPLHK